MVNLSCVLHGLAVKRDSPAVKLLIAATTFWLDRGKSSRRKLCSKPLIAHVTTTVGRAQLTLILMQIELVSGQYMLVTARCCKLTVALAPFPTTCINS